MEDSARMDLVVEQSIISLFKGIGSSTRHSLEKAVSIS
jgi:hypothetical protein